MGLGRTLRKFIRNRYKMISNLIKSVTQLYKCEMVKKQIHTTIYMVLVP